MQDSQFPFKVISRPELPEKLKKALTREEWAQHRNPGPRRPVKLPHVRIQDLDEEKLDGPQAA